MLEKYWEVKVEKSSQKKKVWREKEEYSRSWRKINETKVSSNSFKFCFLAKNPRKISKLSVAGVSKILLQEALKVFAC